MNRLHPRVQFIWTLQAAVFAAVVGAVVGAANFVWLGYEWWLPLAVAGGLLAVGAAFALLRYRLWRYEVRDDSLYLERGVFTRVRTVVPFVRIQHVDSARNPLERLVGLASTVVYTAGSRGADVTIPGLTRDGSDALQDRLKELAIRAEGEDAV